MDQQQPLHRTGAPPPPPIAQPTASQRSIGQWIVDRYHQRHVSSTCTMDYHSPQQTTKCHPGTPLDHWVKEARIIQSSTTGFSPQPHAVNYTRQQPAETTSHPTVEQNVTRRHWKSPPQSYLWYNWMNSWYSRQNGRKFGDSKLSFSQPFSAARAQDDARI